MLKENKDDELMTNRTIAHSNDSCRPNLIFSHNIKMINLDIFNQIPFSK